MDIEMAAADRTLVRARMLAFFLPAALLAGALGFQYLGKLHPCELCLQQHVPHYAAVVAATLAIILRRHPASLLLTILAGLLIVTSGFQAVYHLGDAACFYEAFDAPPRQNMLPPHQFMRIPALRLLGSVRHPVV